MMMIKATKISIDTKLIHLKVVDKNIEEDATPAKVLEYSKNPQIRFENIEFLHNTHCFVIKHPETRQNLYKVSFVGNKSYIDDISRSINRQNNNIINAQKSQEKREMDELRAVMQRINAEKKAEDIKKANSEVKQNIPASAAKHVGSSALNTPKSIENTTNGKVQAKARVKAAFGANRANAANGGVINGVRRVDVIKPILYRGKTYMGVKDLVRNFNPSNDPSFNARFAELYTQGYSLDVCLGKKDKGLENPSELARERQQLNDSISTKYAINDTSAVRSAMKDKKVNYETEEAL